MPTSVFLTTTLHKSECNHSGEQNNICNSHKNQSKQNKEMFSTFSLELNFGVTADSSFYFRLFPQFKVDFIDIGYAFYAIDLTNWNIWGILLIFIYMVHIHLYYKCHMYTASL